MPIIDSHYHPRWLLSSGDLQSVVPLTLKQPGLPRPTEEVLELPDGDFLQLYWHPGQDLSRLVIVTHGLEGSVASNYVIGMTRALLSAGLTVLTWNMRGCGSQPNRLLSWYHSGQSEDLRAVLDRVIHRPWPELLSTHSQTSPPTTLQIALVGFSVGGNITLKLLGEAGENVPSEIRSAFAMSVPVDLTSASDQLARFRNRFYMRYLLAPLRARMREKAIRFPGVLDLSGLDKMRTFHEFDRRFTAPLHGFDSIQHYWTSQSSRQFLKNIRVPTLLLNALDDPFLGPECFPRKEAHESDFLFLETPRHGGHVGFLEGLRSPGRWSEGRGIDFFRWADR
jgi:predicted alpha/beta-fold hydrolase